MESKKDSLFLLWMTKLDKKLQFLWFSEEIIKKGPSRVYEAFVFFIDEKFPFFHYSYRVLLLYKSMLKFYESPYLKKVYVLIVTIPKIVVAFLFFFEVVVMHHLFFFYKLLFLLIFPLLFRLWFFIILKASEKLSTNLLSKYIDVKYSEGYVDMIVTLKPEAEMVTDIDTGEEMSKSESREVFIEILQACHTMKYTYESLLNFYEGYKNWEILLYSGFYACGFFFWATSSYWLT
jgi:hypothetical protein